MLPICWRLRKRAYKIFHNIHKKEAAPGEGRPRLERVQFTLLAVADNRSRTTFEITDSFRRLTDA